MDISIRIKCDKHGTELEETNFSEARGFVEVKPCPDCIKEAKEEGDSEGYDRGVSESESETQ
jgi:hypothetical protein